MFEKKKPAQAQYQFTHDEIDLLSQCIAMAENYYKGLLLLKQDWNKDMNEAAIPMIKAKIRMLEDLQDRTTYIGQSDIYKNL